jgi:WD40 repeat protein
MTCSLYRTIFLLGTVLIAGAAAAREPVPSAEARAGYRERGRLRAGLAFKAREEEHDSLKAALLYVQAAQAFQRAGEDEYHKLLLAGVLAAQPLRWSWPQEQGAKAAFFLVEHREVLTCSGAGDIRVWDAGTSRLLRSFRTPNAEKVGNGIYGAVLSRDRSRLLLWTLDTVQLWDIAGGKFLHTWKPEPIPQGAVFLHNDEQILVWGQKAPLRLYDVATHKELRTFDKGSVFGHGPIFDRPQTRLLTGDGQSVYLWDVATRELLHTFGGAEKENALSAVFTPSGNSLAIYGYADGGARLFDANTGRRLKAFVVERPKEAIKPVRGAVFSPNGSRLLTWGEDDRVRLWDVADGKLLHSFSCRRGEGRFSPDGQFVLTLGDPSVLWDARNGTKLMQMGTADEAHFLPKRPQVLLLGPQVQLWDYRANKLRKTFGPAAEVKFSEDGNLLLTRSVGPGDGIVRLWALQHRAFGWRYPGWLPPQPTGQLFRLGDVDHPDPIRTAVLSGDEKRLLVCGNSGEAILWDAVTVKRLRSFEHGSGGGGAFFSPDEARVLTWGGLTAKLWQTDSGKAVRTLTNAANLRGAVFAPDGKHLLTWDVDYTARWWDVERGEVVHKFEHDRELFGARLDRAGAHVLTWSLDGTAKKWDVRTGRLVWSLRHDSPVFGAAFTSDGGRVWTWSGKGLHEWAYPSGKAVRFLPIKGGVPAAVLGRDGRHFLLRNAQGLVQYWDSASARALATFYHVFNVYGFEESVSGGIFSPEQTRAVTWASDSSIIQWELASGLKLSSGMQRSSRDVSPPVRGAAYTRDGRSILTWGDDGTARISNADIPPSLPPDDQLLELEVRSGLRLDERGNVHQLTVEEWQERRKKWQAVPRKGPPK